MKEQRAKQVLVESLSKSHRATTRVRNVARGLKLREPSCKKRVDESVRGACGSFVDNNSLSFDDLLVLANAASVAFAQDPCKRAERLNQGNLRESSEAYFEGSCFGSPEKLQRNRDLMQKRCGTVPVKVVKGGKQNRDPSDGCRGDELFKKKYGRKKRGNKENLESISVGTFAGTSNLAKKLCRHRSWSLMSVGDAGREEGLPNNGETHSNSEQVEAVEGQGCCSEAKDKSKRKMERGDENQEMPSNIYLYPCILGIENQEIPKRKRSQCKRIPKELKKNLGSILRERSKDENERACDQVDSDAAEAEEVNSTNKAEDEEEEEEEENTISEPYLKKAALGSDVTDKEMVVSESEGSRAILKEAETEEDEEEDVSDARSCNWWSYETRPRSSSTCKRIRLIQWRNKRKRSRMTLEETHRNCMILLLAVDAITYQFGLLDVSMEEQSS